MKRTKQRSTKRKRSAKKRPAKKRSAKKLPAKKLPAKKRLPGKPPPKKLPPTPAPEPTPASIVTDADMDRMWMMMERIKREAAGQLTASIAAFHRELEALDDDGVVRVGSAFNRAMGGAYHNRLWGGAYVLHGGCSDDGFWDFRAGLVALGRDVYEAALADPDTLADIADIEELTIFEGFQYVPNRVAEARGLVLTERQHPKKVAGDGFEDSELPRLFPKLTARFG